MAARDHTIAIIVCPKCGREGTVDVSTSDHPYAKSDDFRVERLPDGFAIHKLSKWQYETLFECTTCNVVAPYASQTP
jgi:transcription elongation factor Elf1